MSGRSRSGAWSAAQRIHGILHPDGNKPGLRVESPFFQKLTQIRGRPPSVFLIAREPVSSREEEEIYPRNDAFLRKLILLLYDFRSSKPHYFDYVKFLPNVQMYQLNF